jgi:hypothetical protein
MKKKLIFFLATKTVKQKKKNKNKNKKSIEKVSLNEN